MGSSPSLKCRRKAILIGGVPASARTTKEEVSFYPDEVLPDATASFPALVLPDAKRPSCFLSALS
jgi:hypothetical protein